MMKLSCSSQSFDPLFVKGEMDLFSFVEFAADTMKLDCVEFEDKHFENRSKEYINKIRKAVEDKGLYVANVAFFNSFGYYTKEENDAQLSAAEEWMDVAVGLGSKNMRIFAGWMGGDNQNIGFEGSIRPKTQEAWDTMVSYLIKVCEKAKEKGLQIVIENHNHGGFLSVSDDVIRLFSQVKEDNFSLLLDTGNYADGISGIEKTVDKIKHHVHLKCRDIQEDGSDKAFDLDKIIAIIKSSGYTGNLSIEYEGTQPCLEVLPKIAEFAKKRI